MITLRRAAHNEQLRSLEFAIRATLYGVRIANLHQR